MNWGLSLTNTLMAHIHQMFHGIAIELLKHCKMGHHTLERIKIIMEIMASINNDNHLFVTAYLIMQVLGVFEWSGVDPIPPELFLLPSWVPIQPGRFFFNLVHV